MQHTVPEFSLQKLQKLVDGHLMIFSLDGHQSVTAELTSVIWKGQVVNTLGFVLAMIALSVVAGIVLMGTGKKEGSWHHRAAISVWAFGPFAAAIAAPFFGMDKLSLAVFAVGYIIPGFGVTVGYHRLLTHKSFKCGPVVRAFFIISGMMALQGSAIRWVEYHLRHHADTDGPTDPHSPHAYGKGFGNAARGLVHAHIGWMFDSEPPDPVTVKALREDKVLSGLNSFWWVFVLIRLFLPFGIGYAIGGMSVAVAAALWGATAAFLTLHSTFSVNSVCHMWGSQPYRTEGFPKNFWLLAPFTLGEAFHNGHHAFVWSARHGITPVERTLDFSWWLIFSLKKLGLVWDVKVPTPEQVRRKSLKPVSKAA